MFDFYEKRKLRSVLYSKFTVVVLFLVAVFLSTSVYARYQAEVLSAEKRATRAEDLKRLEERANILEGKVNMLESERGKETLMREQYDVKKGNEEVVVIVDEDKKRDAAATATVPVVTKPPLFHWLKFW